MNESKNLIDELHTSQLQDELNKINKHFKHLHQQSSEFYIPQFDQYTDQVLKWIHYTATEEQKILLNVMQQKLYTGQHKFKKHLESMDNKYTMFIHTVTHVDAQLDEQSQEIPII